MPAYAWEPFLLNWEREIFASPLYRERRPYLEPELAQRQSLRNPGASKAQLRALENRLTVTLPPSYREFLAYTNGWRQIGMQIEHLWSTEEVEWFAARNQEWIDIWRSELGDAPPPTDEEYLVYGSTRATPMRVEYLDSLLELSNSAGLAAVYVLNPQIVTPTGEWEAWRLEEDFVRFPSFWDLMQSERDTFHQLV